MLLYNNNLRERFELMENTYQITANELIEVCELIKDGYTLNEVTADDKIMSVTLINGKTKEESVFNFLR